jgi:hypothetical protein
MKDYFRNDVEAVKTILLLDLKGLFTSESISDRLIFNPIEV